MLNWKRSIGAILCSILLLLAVSLSAFACTTIIVGKNASATGEILFGHNEDNGGRLVMPQYRVPRIKHSAGEMIQLEPGKAQIPQVEETLSYLWSETRSPLPGSSFSDFFVNERGVVIASDSCWPSRENSPELKDAGVGYAIRRLMAERAQTAREAVEIAAKLLDEYGYFSSGRSYQIADANEAWVLQIVNGRNYAARRVPDDEVMVIPNHYTIRKIDFDDRKNFIVSPGLVEHAIDKGWYVPSKKGDYSDFDFAAAYQRPDRFRADYNVVRHTQALEILLGRTLDSLANLPFSAKSDRKIDIDTMKKALRTHYEGTPDDLTKGYETAPHFTDRRVICTSTTRESVIVQIRKDPDFTIIWKALGRPCINPYVPWFAGITRIPSKYGWIEPELGMATHFSSPASDYAYDPNRAWWAFQDLQNMANPQYGAVIGEIRRNRDELETKWTEELPQIESQIRELCGENTEKIRNMMSVYTDRQATLARENAQKMFAKLNVHKMTILASEINLNDQDGIVRIILDGDEDLDASKLRPDSFRLGLACNSPRKYWAQAKSVSVEDRDEDGDIDALLSFRIGDFSRRSTPCYMDMWMTAEDKDGKVYVIRDLVDFVRR